MGRSPPFTGSCFLAVVFVKATPNPTSKLKSYPAKHPVTAITPKFIFARA